MKKEYTSKVSYGILLFIFLIFYAPIIPELSTNGLDGKMAILIGFLTLIFMFILHFFLNTKYSIENKELKIKCGIIAFKPIAIETIKEISKTKSIMSSPAPSFDRIEIKYGKFNTVIISPKNKYNFTKDLVKINPNIKNNIAE